MEVKSQTLYIFFIFIILLAFHFSLVAPTNTWVGSKYQIECTMCAACDNPCNQQSPPPPPSPPLCPPPPSITGGYYYSPPPPTTGTGGYYYSPPPPTTGTGGGYYYSPPQSPNRYYPTPGPPNPIMGYYPYYYYNYPPPYSAAGVSLSGATTLMLLTNIFLFCLFI